MTKENILNFAKNSIFTTVTYIGKWKDYDVWEPGFDDDEPHYIGFPQFILVKDDKIRWSKDDDESREIMKALW